MALVLTVMGWLRETVIKSLIDKVWDKMKELGSLGGERGVGDALKDLEISLNNIQSTIDRAENMLTRDQSLRQNVNKMLLQLKDTTYDAEDLLDKFEFRKLQKRINQQSNDAGDLSSSSSVWSRLMKKRKIGEDSDQDLTEIRRIREELEKIRIDMENLLSSDNRRYMQNITEINRVTSSYPIETKLFGRDKELKDLMRLLLEPDQSGSKFGSSNNISILTITGMGGVGKTTLAQEVYNDERVKGHFNLRIWVCVSEDFNVERLTKEIIESATKRTYNFSNIDALQRIVNENIRSKKFLLVLDDVWNEDSCKWDRRTWDNLCAPLRSAVIGSKILVTTRDKKIPKFVGSVNLIHLDGLDYNECFLFLKKCAFGSENSEDHPQLEAIAKEMVPKLKGLPLAAKTLGGLLSINMNEQHWRTIMYSEIWKLPQEENGVLLVLQLSYLYLPAHLKRCFAFCSLFQKDYKFDEHELVRIWMAEGFFPSQENIRMEDFGSRCFHELVSRSFYQKSEYSNRYVMHDLIHDLAQLVSEGEIYRLEDGKQFNILPTVRRMHVVSIKDDKGLSTMIGSNYFSKFRTFICDQEDSFKNSKLTCQFFKRLQTVRTLILVDCGLTEIPESIGDLFYLRYLDISLNIMLNELLESLCCLSNLQTLQLCRCSGLQSLPQGTSKLINLRKLDAHNDLVSKITSVGKLTSLQSLSFFKVGKEQGHKLAELGGLTRLHGELKISGLENVENKNEAIAANMQSKEHLDELVFEWTIDRDDDAFIISEELLEQLQPNSTLKRLTIRGYSGVKSSSWLEAESLSRLETLSLCDCKRWNDLSFIRKLSHLKSLILHRLHAVTRISQELFGSTTSSSLVLLERFVLEDMTLLEELSILKCFPLLKELKIRNMPVWSSWLEDNECFPCLSVLQIYNCPSLISSPPLPPLTELTLTQVGLKGLPSLNERFGGSNRGDVSPLNIQINGCPHLASQDQIEYFPCLSVLQIEHCPSLISLPPLSSSLTELTLTRVGLKELPSLKERIGVSSSSSITIISPLNIQINGCPYLASLDQIECFPCLSVLQIEDCPSLISLPRLPSSLTKLRLTQVGLKELPEMGGRSNNITTKSPLKRICINGCLHLTSLDQIECFPCLCVLYIENCPSLIKLPPLPLLVTELTLTQVGLKGLLEMGGSSNSITTKSPLKKICIKGCLHLTSLDQIECFPCLSVLQILDCPSLISLPPLPRSLTLLVLTQVGLKGLPEMSGSSSNITTVSFSELDISRCSNIISLEQGLLSYSLPELTRISVDDCRELHWMPVKKFIEFTKLKYLTIYNCPKLMTMAQDDDNRLLLPPSIQRLVLSDCGKVSKSLLGCIDNLTSLVELKLQNCPHLVTLPREPLLHLERLETLKLVNCSELRSIEGLGVLRSLKRLIISGCPKLQVYEEDGRGENLLLGSTSINLRIDNTSLLKVWPLRNMLPSIEDLQIQYSQEVTMLEGEDKELFRSLTSLRCLEFFCCKNLEFLPTELHALPHLKSLVICGCPQIQSLPEKGLPISLENKSCYMCHPTLEKQMKEYLTEMKNSGRLF